MRLSGDSWMGRAWLALLLVAVPVAGCGGTTLTKQDKQYMTDVQQRCASLLTPVEGAIDATKTNAPRDDVIARAATALSNAASAVLNVQPPSSQQQGHHVVSADLQTAAGAMQKYLRDQQKNVSQTTADYNGILEHLSQLQQDSSRYNVKTCALPTQ